MNKIIERVLFQSDQPIDKEILNEIEKEKDNKKKSEIINIIKIRIKK